jgi:hypothetical protein
MTMFMTAQQLIDAPRDMRPHVVLLGAGASHAAFPSGDATGRRIPLMDDLVDTLGLQRMINEIGSEIGKQKNFECIYSKIVGELKYTAITEQIERHVHEYFSEMLLSNEAMLYDRLLISLRPTDALITFNWDPFLFDAYERNRNAVPLPGVFFCMETCESVHALTMIAGEEEMGDAQTVVALLPKFHCCTRSEIRITPEILTSDGIGRLPES